MLPLTGLVLGLAGSLHCVGMCGPIVLAVQGSGVQSSRLGLSWPSLAPKLEYQLGRILMYSVLGAIVGLTSSAFSLAGIGRIVTIASGVLMILFAVGELLFQRGVVPQHLAEAWNRTINRLYKRASGNRCEFKRRHLLLGILNGLLPCGLVTSALMGAVSMGNVVDGALFMAFFGMGTLPLLLAVAIAGVSLSCTLKARLRLALPGFALLLGTLILLRGMALGVPYISPEAPSEKAPSPKHSCCVAAEKR